MAAPPPPCRFFQVGSCTKGADCRFAHAKDAGDGGRLKLSQPCVFFAQGRCAYGDRCAYLHGDIHLNAIPTDSSSSGRSSSQQSMHARISCPRSTPTNHPTQSASKSQGSEGIAHGVRDATQSKIPIASPGAVNPHSQRSHLSGIERDSTAAPCGSGTFCSPSGVDPNELCKEMQNLRFAYEDDEVDGDFVATEEEKQERSRLTPQDAWPGHLVSLFTLTILKTFCTHAPTACIHCSTLRSLPCNTTA
eukprot:6189408-Pleurochrysis_carterae.AAC.1